MKTTAWLLLFAVGLLLPSSFALFENASIQRFDYPVSQDAGFFANGLAADPASGWVIVGLNLEKPKAHSEKVDIRLMAWNPSSQQIESVLDISQERFGANNPSWYLKKLAVSPDGRVFGLFAKHGLGPRLVLEKEPLESAIFELPALKNWKSAPTVQRLTTSTNTVFWGLFFFNGSLFTATKQKIPFGQKWGLTQFFPASGQEKFIENADEFYNIVDLAVSPNGTMIGFRYAPDMKEQPDTLVVYQLSSNGMKLLQTIPYAPLNLGLPFVGGISSLAAQDDFFVAGTTWSYVESFRKTGAGFEFQPDQRQRLDSESVIPGIWDLALTDNRLVVAFPVNEYAGGHLFAARLENAGPVAQAIRPETVSLAQKAQALEESPLAQNPPLVPLAKEASELVVQLSFDKALSQKIESKNPSKTAFDVLQENSSVLVDGVALTRGQDFFITNGDSFYIKNFSPFLASQKKLEIKSQIPPFKGSGVLIEIAATQSFLDAYKNFIPIELVSKGASG